MKDIFQKFLLKFNGENNVGNTPENKGECTGLCNIFIVDYLLKSFIWGNAKDFINNYNPLDFEVILNTPEAIPQAGDIVIWGQSYNGNYGHVGIATGTGDLNTFEAFEQNDPLGSNCHLKTYKYTYVIGWLHPKKIVLDCDPNWRIERDHNWNLYSPFKDAGFPAIDDVIKAIEEKQVIIRAVDGFRVALTKSLGIEGSDWQRIVDEVNKTIKERDDTLSQAKVGDTLWDAIVKQTGLQVVKYTDEGVKSLVDALELLKKAVPEGYRILAEEEYTQLMARKTLDRFDKWELFVEFLKRFFK